MRRGRGFTLFELIAVMVLIAMVFAMIAPSVGGFAAAAQARDAGGMLLTAADFARMRAMQDGRPYRLNIDIDENLCHITRREGYAFTALPDAWGNDIHIDRKVTLAWQSVNAEPFITFEPDGSAESRVLYVIGPRGDAFTLAVDGATGRYAVKQSAEVLP